MHSFRSRKEKRGNPRSKIPIAGHLAISKKAAAATTAAGNRPAAALYLVDIGRRCALRQPRTCAYTRRTQRIRADPSAGQSRATDHEKAARRHAKAAKSGTGATILRYSTYTKGDDTARRR